MKAADVIRRTSDEGMAKIIGAVVLQHTEGISAEEAIKFDYPNTLKALQREIEIDYKPTNADRIRSMSDEEMAKFIAGLNEHCLAGVGACDCSNIKEIPCYKVCEKVTRKWLQSEAEGE